MIKVAGLAGCYRHKAKIIWTEAELGKIRLADDGGQACP